MVFRITLVFGSGIFLQQIGMSFYGIASAAEIAFYSLTSWTRASTMAGRTFGYLLSQTIVITGIGNYLTVNQISLSSPILVFVFGLCFPRIQWKSLVERIKTTADAETFNEPTTYGQYVKFRMGKLWSNTKRIYGIGFVRKWSL
uniref:MFS domain-containing protein n=1 Tax=Elaeophora elaphi TaxID=1147741 RepID=A0A0R3RP08_9BILA